MRRRWKKTRHGVSLTKVYLTDIGQNTPWPAENLPRHHARSSDKLYSFDPLNEILVPGSLFLTPYCFINCSVFSF